MKKKVRLSGFSLLEVSISLLIIGIVSSVSMTQLNTIRKLYSTQKTQANIEFVVKSLAAYYLSNEGVLPYPSDVSQNIGNQSLNMKNSFGIVPFKTLGIMDRFAKNGNGKFLLYRVNPFFRKATSSVEQKNLGIKDFSSGIKDDKVAIIIKSQNAKNQDEIIIWYSEKNFISNFANNKIITKPVEKIGIATDFE